MAQFKVGDRVRVLDTEENRLTSSLYRELRLGSEHVVREVTEDGWLKLAGHRAGCGWVPSRFELVEPRKDTPKVGSSSAGVSAGNAKAVPSVGDTVRVVLEGKVASFDEDGFGISARGNLSDNYIVPDQGHVKSIEIITPAKPSVKDLPVGSVVKLGSNEGGLVYHKVSDDDWRRAGRTMPIRDGILDAFDWTQLVPKGSE